MFMYMHLTSSGEQSMNNANYALRHATAVDYINATNLLLKLESERFAKQQLAAWNHEGYFMPCSHIVFVLRMTKIFTLVR